MEWIKLIGILIILVGFIFKFDTHFAKNTDAVSVLLGFRLPGIAPGSKFCYSK